MIQHSIVHLHTDISFNVTMYYLIYKPTISFNLTMYSTSYQSFTLNNYPPTCQLLVWKWHYATTQIVYRHQQCWSAWTMKELFTQANWQSGVFLQETFFGQVQFRHQHAETLSSQVTEIMLIRYSWLKVVITVVLSWSIITVFDSYLHFLQLDVINVTYRLYNHASWDLKILLFQNAILVYKKLGPLHMISSKNCFALVWAVVFLWGETPQSSI